MSRVVGKGRSVSIYKCPLCSHVYNNVASYTFHFFFKIIIFFSFFAFWLLVFLLNIHYIHNIFFQLFSCCWRDFSFTIQVFSAQPCLKMLPKIPFIFSLESKWFFPFLSFVFEFSYTIFTILKIYIFKHSAVVKRLQFFYLRVLCATMTIICYR